MSSVSYLRTPTGNKMTVYRGRRGAKQGTPGGRGRGPWLIAGGVIVLVICVLAAGALIVSGSRAKIASDPSALARIDLPLGGGSVTRVVATTGVQNNEKFVRVLVKGDPVVYPGVKIPAGEKLTVTATVRRPGWISWLTGHEQRVTRTVTVPATSVHDRFITLTKAGALQVRFSKPVRTISYGATATTVRRHTLVHAERTVTLPHTAVAGTMYVAATVQRWETSPAESVNWFPSGTKATAVASPSSGKTIRSDTPITLTFSKPVSAVLGSHLPTVSPAGAARWHTISSHAIRLIPTGYGYGLGEKVSVALPAGVRIAGVAQGSSASTATWNVPDGSTTRLQQMLAQLGYLPFKVDYTAAKPADTLAAQETAAEDPPAATLSWAYADTPAGLKAEWGGAAKAGVMTQGALMRFQTDHDLDVTGFEDSETWNALFQAIVKNQRNTFGYTFVSSTETLPEHLFVWHSGRTVLSNILDNSGVPGAGTDTGTYPVFEHAPSVTMIGTNVDGSHYDDPDIRWVSYFHGGDALHAYPRASYGFPQSNGCLEMSETDAAEVYPFTPVGTLVQVTS
jgi:peptidoglycan hydrolase-like protein with peptidoglycan-binding domain